MKRKGVYSWENEPADARRSEFRSSTDSGWQQSAQSTFAEPSRLDSRQHERRVRRRHHRQGRARRLWIAVATLSLSALAALWALWPALAKHLQR